MQDSGGGGGGAEQLAASVTTPVYDGAFADSNDIPFAWAEFTPAAKGLYDLAQAIGAARSALVTAQTTASRDWKGPYRDDFDAKCTTFKESADRVKSALETLADGLANAWVAARGQQGRICAARGFAHREAEESGLNKFGDSLFGDEEANEPADPAQPSAPGYARTDPPPHEDGCSTTATHGSIDA